MSPTEAARERAGLLADAPSGGFLRGVRQLRLVTRIVEAVVQTALPPVCAGCGVSGHWMCPVCDLHNRRIVLEKVCHRCGSMLENDATCDRCQDWGTSLAACRSAYAFDGAVRKSIHRLKYHGEYARAEWCGREVARLLIELEWEPDLIVPVPLHRSRLRSRGFNQSARIATATAALLDVPTGSVLERIRATASQVGLDAAGRRVNVWGAFASPHDLRDLAIVLVDDVVTTGATLESCAEACRVAGARDVRAVTVATGT